MKMAEMFEKKIYRIIGWSLVLLAILLLVFFLVSDSSHSISKVNKKSLVKPQDKNLVTPENLCASGFRFKYDDTCYPLS